MTFAASIAAGLAHAAGVAGVAFTLEGGPTLQGIVDRRADTSKPADGGIALDWDATLLVAKAQLVQTAITDPAGDPILDPALTPLLDDIGLQIGRKLVVLSQTMRIVGIDYDGHQYTLRLANVNQ